MPGSVMQRRAELLSAGVYKNLSQLNVDVRWPLLLYAACCNPKLVAHSFSQVAHRFFSL